MWWENSLRKKVVRIFDLERTCFNREINFVGLIKMIKSIVLIVLEEIFVGSFEQIKRYSRFVNKH